MDDELEAVDFAVAAYRHDGEWRVDELVLDHLEDATALVGALRRLPGETGSIGLVAVDEDWFLLVRVQGPDVRLVLSDVTAAQEWDLADSAVEMLGLLGVRVPDDDDLDAADDDTTVPAGHLDLLADLGLPAAELTEMIDDVDSYPDEVCADVAERLGFGELFDDLLDESAGLTPA